MCISSPQGPAPAAVSGTSATPSAGAPLPGGTPISTRLSSAPRCFHRPLWICASRSAPVAASASIATAMALRRPGVWLHRCCACRRRSARQRALPTRCAMVLRCTPPSTSVSSPGTKFATPSPGLSPPTSSASGTTTRSSPGVPAPMWGILAPRLVSCTSPTGCMWGSSLPCSPARPHPWKSPRWPTRSWPPWRTRRHRWCSLRTLGPLPPSARGARSFSNSTRISCSAAALSAPT
mmetsp:Transcript_21549/g.48652  ORF Transcript_21549/g.48652 Transcript_21549/m.48652 type:complete len:236 (+) Transcript_21549:3220-3927(+)